LLAFSRVPHRLLAIFMLCAALAGCGREGGGEETSTTSTTDTTQTQEPTGSKPGNKGDSKASKCKEAEYLACAAGVTISFEQGTAGWAEFNDASLSQTQAEADSGKASLEVVTKGTAGFEGTETADVPVEPGGTYTAVANVRAPKGASMQITIRERDGSETEVDAVAAAFDGTGKFETVQVEQEFGDKGENLRIQIRTGEKPQAITFQVDSVTLLGAGKD